MARNRVGIACTHGVILLIAYLMLNCVNCEESVPNGSVVCYHGTWSTYRSGDGQFDIEDIDPNLCTHAIYAFATINADTFELESFDPNLDIELLGYERFVALKEQNPELKVLLAVGGGSDSANKFSSMVSTASNRDAFIQSAVRFAERYSYDGFDLDWEYPTNEEDKENFAILVSEMREEFGKSGLLLTSAIGLGYNVLNTAYNFTSLCEHLDLLNLMAYDLYGYWDGFTGHHTSLHAHPNLGSTGYGLTEALELVKNLGGCPEKMVLGMAMYGRTYTLVDEQLTDIGSATIGPGAAGPYTQENGTLGFNEMCSGPSYQQDIDNYTMAPWAYNGLQWVCYDNVESIKYKSKWALENNLAGGMIWSVETDDFGDKCGQGRYPLLTQINKIIRPAAITTSPSPTISASDSTPESETIVPTTSPLDRKVVCYLGTWSYYREGSGKFQVEDIDPFLCTHVIYAFAALNENTYEMEAFDSNLDLDHGNYQKFVALKEQNPELKVLIAIGGWSEGSEKYSAMASTQESRDIFVQSALSFVQQYSFDGLDLDWEYPANRGGAPEDKANFAQLVSELRTVFDKNSLLLTAAIGIGADVLESAYNFESLCQDLDFIGLMAYDLHGSWEDFTGHHTSLHAHPSIGDSDYGLTEALNLIKELGGCLNKMVLGMGTYGKSYTLLYEQLTDIGKPTTGPGLAGPYTAENGTLGFNEICLNLNYKQDIDDYTMAPWAFDGFQWVCYDDVESVKYKSEWALENGLLGGMIWSLETDDFRGDCGQGRYPLLSQISESIRPATTTSQSSQSTSSVTPSPPITDGLKIVCYLGTWSYYRHDDGKFQVEDIDPFLCTHVIYAFAALNENTYEMEAFDSNLDLDHGNYQKFVALKEQNPELKVLIAIGGWSEGSEKYSAMASTQESRDTFVQSALSFVQQYSFDGLDLDWEYPANRGGAPEDKENFALLVSELRTAFGGTDLLLTSAIGIGQDVLETAYDFESLCQNLDFMNLMAYDLHGSWEDFTGHHTSLHAHPALGDADYGLTEALEVLKSLGACVDKIVLGMGTYGKTYTLADETSTGIGAPASGAGNPGQYTQESGMMGYNELCMAEGYQRDIDNYTMAPWAYKEDHWVCYDDVESIRVKCEWAIQNGMLGGMIWSLETDDFRGNCEAGRYPLLTQINESFRSSSNDTQTTDASTTTTPLGSSTTISTENSNTATSTSTIAATTPTVIVSTEASTRTSSETSSTSTDAVTSAGTTDSIAPSSSTSPTSTSEATTSTEPSISPTPTSTSEATTTTSQSSQSTSSVTPYTPKTDGRKIVCYLGTWSYYRPDDGQFQVEDIDPFLCTHAIYAFAALNESTYMMEAFDSYLDLVLGNYQKFVALKEQNPELKVLIAIGGWSEGSEKYSAMASSQESRNTFIQSALSFVQQYSFDGLDLDWEYPANRGGAPEDKENFALLVSELRAAFGGTDLLLTSAIGIGQDVLETAYDFESLCQNLDFMNLMAYDLHGSWEDFTGHHTSLHAHPALGDADYGLTEALEVLKSLGACVDKIVLGMGTYGKTYTLADETSTGIGAPASGAGNPGQYTRESGMMGYNELCMAEGYQRDIDNYTMAPWAYKGDQWVCYDDVESIRVKCEWAIQNGMLGGMIWSLETDDFRGNCEAGRYPLLTQINESFRSSANDTQTTAASTTTTPPGSSTSISTENSNAATSTSTIAATTPTVIVSTEASTQTSSETTSTSTDAVTSASTTDSIAPSSSKSSTSTSEATTSTEPSTSTSTTTVKTTADVTTTSSTSTTESSSVLTTAGPVVTTTDAPDKNSARIVTPTSFFWVLMASLVLVLMIHEK